MKKWLHKTEHIIDKIIPIALITLIFLIIGEIFFKEKIHPYLTYVNIVDWIIIILFIIDLTFKWFRIQKVPKFIRKYWLEIIAIFPFFLIFRALEGLSEIIFTIREISEPTQKALHVGSEVSKEIITIEKGAGEIIKEAEAAGKISRTERFARFLRPIARSPRFLKLTNKETKREFKKDIKFIEKEERKIIKESESILERLFKRIINAVIFFEKPSKKKK